MGCDLSLGAFLPEIDHTRSIIGRLFPSISYPIHTFIGHRMIAHSLLMWAPLTVIGLVFFKPLGLIALGACLHAVLDTANISGVPLLYPFSEKIFVFGGRKTRLGVGSKTEIALFFVFSILAYAGWYVSSQGGIRFLVAYHMGNYKMSYQKYLTKGTQVCYFNGILRLTNGRLLKDRFLIVGIEGSGLCVYDKTRNRTIHLPKEGVFISASLVSTEDQWHTLKLSDPATIGYASDLVFYRSERLWIRAYTGSSVHGEVLYRGTLTID